VWTDAPKITFLYDAVAAAEKRRPQSKLAIAAARAWGKPDPLLQTDKCHSPKSLSAGARELIWPLVSPNAEVKQRSRKLQFTSPREELQHRDRVSWPPPFSKCDTTLSSSSHFSEAECLALQEPESDDGDGDMIPLWKALGLYIVDAIEEPQCESTAVATSTKESRVPQSGAVSYSTGSPLRRRQQINVTTTFGRNG
jgi:hypothetical protein